MQRTDHLSRTVPLGQSRAGKFLAARFGWTLFTLVSATRACQVRIGGRSPHLLMNRSHAGLRSISALPHMGGARTASRSDADPAGSLRCLHAWARRRRAPVARRGRCGRARFNCDSWLLFHRSPARRRTGPMRQKTRASASCSGPCGLGCAVVECLGFSARACSSFPRPWPRITRIGGRARHSAERCRPGIQLPESETSLGGLRPIIGYCSSSTTLPLIGREASLSQ